MSQRIIKSEAAGKVICDAIYSADVTFKDQIGNVLFVLKFEGIASGDTMEIKVPVPEDITIIVEGKE